MNLFPLSLLVLYKFKYGLNRVAQKLFYCNAVLYTQLCFSLFHFLFELVFIFVFISRLNEEIMAAALRIILKKNLCNQKLQKIERDI